MDQFKKISALERHFGRIVRNLSVQRMPSLDSGTWPAADLYETQWELIVLMDISGLDPEQMAVVAHSNSVTVSGERQFPKFDDIRCIHQLEMERGHFERTIALPDVVDVSATSSVYKNGFLIITLPKQQSKGKIKIKVS